MLLDEQASHKPISSYFFLDSSIYSVNPFKNNWYKVTPIQMKFALKIVN